MTDVAAWFLYAVFVALLAGVAALAGEAALRSAGRGGRMAWAAAMLVSLGMPVAAWLELPGRLRSEGVLPDAAWLAIPLAPVAAGPSVEAASAAGRVPAPLFVWVLGTVLILGWVVVGLVRLRVARRGWRAARVDGHAVLVTRSVGPAVLGLRRAKILLPEWALRLEAGLRRLLLLHEAEHVRAGDPRLVFGGLLAVAAMPWNPVLWWQYRRLRLAVELDCDGRVVRRTGEVGAYGALLLEVGRRRAGPALMLTFAEPATFLERRIRALVAGSRRRLRRAAALSGVAVVLAVLAVCAKDPLRPGDPLPLAPVEGEPVSTADAGAREALAAGPVFTPYTVPPRLANTAETLAALHEAYPPLLRDAGIGGTVNVWLFVDETGAVQRLQLHRSSGHGALDAAALGVAARMRFTAALNRDRAVPVWVSIPVTFAEPDAGPAPGRAAADAPTFVRDAVPAGLPPAAAGRPLQETPVFTPYTVAPRLRNTAVVERALERNYPPLLRDAGIGGTVNVWFFIDENGTVLRRLIQESSGYGSLDEAALRVAEAFEFTPAFNRDRRVPVWISVPVTFSSR